MHRPLVQNSVPLQSPSELQLFGGEGSSTVETNTNNTTKYSLEYSDAEEVCVAVPKIRLLLIHSFLQLIELMRVDSASENSTINFIS